MVSDQVKLYAHFLVVLVVEENWRILLLVQIHPKQVWLTYHKNWGAQKQMKLLARVMNPSHYKFIENIVMDIFVLIRKDQVANREWNCGIAGGSSFTRKDSWESVTFITCSRWKLVFEVRWKKPQSQVLLERRWSFFL